MAFLRWQGEGAGRYKGYRDLWKRVRRAMKMDQEKWLDGAMKGLEDDMKWHRLGSVFKEI